MEFSFDRSREAQSRKPENTSHADAGGVRPGPDLNTLDTSTIANERLRKAIERNRAKQAERDAQRPPQAPQFSQAQAEQYHQQNSFFSQQASQSQPQQQMHQEIPVQPEATRETRQAPPMPPRETMRQAAPVNETEAHERPATSQTPRASLRSRMSARMNSSEAPKETINARDINRDNMTADSSTTVVSRRSVAKPDDTEFVPVKRAPKKVASQISYTTNSSRKKSKPVDPKYVTWLVKGSWIFCGIMVLRLIFAAGGVTDYYSQKSSVNDRVAELAEIKKDNMQLVRDIERMRSDTGFQKKLVRDNLGFIAADEFLVLFPKDK